MSQENQGATRSETAAERRRFVRDPDGRDWLVYELERQPDFHEGPTLVFDAPDVIRRVRNYPPDWFDRPDADLCRLSNQR